MTNGRTKDQQAAIDKLGKLKVGALFMDMGTGKTKTALDLMASKAHKVDYMLWLCPCSLKGEIEQERQKWHLEMELDVVGIESIGASDRIYLKTREKMEGKRCFMVVDESLKIKNIRAKRTKRAIALGRLAEYKLILNGTPLSRNIMDIWAQMDFLSPRILNMTYRQFKDCYTEYYTSGRMAGVIKNQVNVEHLISKISPYVFDAELDIAPRKKYRDHWYCMNAPEEYAYDDIKQEAYEEWLKSGEPDMDMYGLFARLQRHYTRASDRISVLDDVMEEIEGKVIVFVKYLDSIPEGVPHITGDMKTQQRVDTINEFEKSDDKALYITYGCGSFGLNLQFCHEVIFLEHMFDYAQRVQAEARVYRLGQEYDVVYHSLWCDCGMEDLIQKNLIKKENLLDEVRGEIEKQGTKAWLDSL